MVTLDLTPEERDTLVEMLGSLHSDLRMEIADTDRLEYRDRIRERKRVVAKVLEALGAGTAEG